MAAETTGVIHDLGYQHYQGERLGRAHIVRTLTWYSLRSAFGLGRGAKAKIIPFTALGLMCLPAIVSTVITAEGGHRAFAYDTYSFPLRLIVMTIFIAAQAPELVSRDLRHRVLPLYFARPLQRSDYPLAKLAALVTACLVMLDVPLLLLYVGTISSAHGGAAVWAQTRALVPGLAIGLLWAVVLAAIGLALASLSGRRAYATGAVAVTFFLSATLSEILINIAGDPTSAGARVGGLFSPFYLLDGVRQWLGGTSPGPAGPPGDFGPGYGVALLALLAAAVAGLVARYRKADVA